MVRQLSASVSLLDVMASCNVTMERTSSAVVRRTFRNMYTDMTDDLNCS